MEMEIDSPPQLLAEKFEKTLRIEDDDYVFVEEEAEESEEEESSSEEEKQQPPQQQRRQQQQVPRGYNPSSVIWDEPQEDQTNYTYQQLCFEIADEVAKDFIHQVDENRFGEFPWPPDLSCPLFRYGYICRYLIKLEPEDVGSMVVQFSIKSNPEEMERAKRFLEQMRSSWGYDLDCDPPHWFGCSIYPIVLEDAAEAEEAAQAEEAARWAISRVNKVAGEMGKIDMMLELKSLDKAVRGCFSVYLVSFTVKTVLGDAIKKVRASVGFAPSAPAPILLECKLVP
ncbi:OSBP(oxysterol binding protein)-related protein2B [Striga asiatica]|uniref:OSBP(Oxysterol binding protein)-related protein2B n=1 Tax=Striga asiatica TaxID=4170 RepID=A0A5A7QBF3_STRAF|nr:OSBP(oxysterol binding protein)-related protein2B [Striga asiatica]